MHYINKIAATAAALGCVLSTPLYAADQAGKTQPAQFSYNYAQISFVDLDAGFEGLMIGGSHDVGQDLAISASYMSTDSSSALDYDVFTIGLVHHQRLAQIPRSDLALHGEILHASLDYMRAGSIRSDDDNGLRFGGMIRHQVQKNLEVFGDLSYSSLYDHDLGLTAGANLELNEQFAVIASVELSDDDMLLLGIRMELK
ncbi:MAG: hypothetical protein A2V90_09650 [Gammaproteobacteria bacterium RBG_16_57_12]|nr:MAG: hypothetical protein A2V90_09650 [Gammaproteobacteria bacterium RBG_16_57_12]